MAREHYTPPPQAKSRQATKINVGSVGNERKGDVKGVQEGGSLASACGLRGAIGELKSQHPHAYDSRGPHHGGNDHVRHMPLHGMRPGRS